MSTLVSSTKMRRCWRDWRSFRNGGRHRPREPRPSQRLHRREHRLGVAVHFDLAPLGRSTPLASMRNVLRSTPMYFLPYMLFS